MRLQIIILFSVIMVFSCGERKTPITGETEFQRQMNAEYKDATTSPLKDKDRKKFKGLDFFKFNPEFVVQATFERTPDEKAFEMKTTTDRLLLYVKFGIAKFQLYGNTYTLNVYKAQNYLLKGASDNTLFLPFLDDTNGETTYGGGRYINLKIPEGNLLEIDFNRAYNPYCVYNEKYSCPIVPRENYIPLVIEAGVKNFKKE